MTFATPRRPRVETCLSPIARLLTPAALALALMGGAALAETPSSQPRSINDCEKIEGDHEFNLCLASFGTKRGERATPPAAAPETVAATTPAKRVVAARGRRGERAVVARRGNSSVVFTRGRSGRVSAQIDVTPRRSARRR